MLKTPIFIYLRSFFAQLAIALLMLLFCMSTNALAMNKLLGCQAKLVGGNTTLILNFSKDFKYSVLQLSNPERLVVDVEDTIWSLPAEPANSAALVKQIRHGIQNGTTLRVVFDLQAKAKLLNTEQPQANQLIFKFASSHSSLTAPRTLKAATSNLSPVKPVELKFPAAQAKSLPNMPPPLKSRRPVIVIDAGHGGHDPGTIGRHLGLEEKQITLSYAKALKQALESSGRYKVVMTRNNDNFLYLNQRMDKAQHAKANLFISLHADSHSNHQMRGASVYTLADHASDKDAELLARQENKADFIPKIHLGKANNEIKDILIDLVHRETKNNSVEFASLLLAELRENVPLVNKSHRFASFKVLTGIDTPAVLIELGYLSNKTEEHLLSTKAYRHKFITAIACAIDRRFSNSSFSAGQLGASGHK